MTYTQAQLRAGTEAHYVDAEFYDRFYRRRKADIAFYIKTAKKFVKPGGAILELGCGSGRVTRHLVDAGFKVTGVDRMQPMLDRARALGLDNVRWICQPIEALSLQRRFDLIIAPFNVWMHFYTPDHLYSAFDAVRRHLSSRGHFVFDVLMPDLAFLNRNPEKIYAAGTLLGPGRVKYRYAERFEYDPISQIQMMTLLFSDIQSGELCHVVPLTHRYVFPQEMAAVLKAAQLTPTHVWQDFSDVPLSATAESMIWVCTR